jgi:hypothetical protein
MVTDIAEGIPQHAIDRIVGGATARLTQGPAAEFARELMAEAQSEKALHDHIEGGTL